MRRWCDHDDARHLCHGVRGRSFTHGAARTDVARIVAAATAIDATAVFGFFHAIAINIDSHSGDLWDSLDIADMCATLGDRRAELSSINLNERPLEGQQQQGFL